jgi:UDP-2,3-diacylglucosamine pyrophosphatase LpxH
LWRTFRAKELPVPKSKLTCETVFISDVHLGTPDAKAEQATRFLKHIRCRKLVLNGDIIDGWNLRRKGRWEKSHTRFIRQVLKMMEKHDTEVVYLRGNHDDILERFMPLNFGGLRVQEEYIHRTPAGDYLVVHGDGFDNVTTRHAWIARLGAVGYDLLLAFNRAYNRWRAWRGKEYFSISKAIKARVKGAVSFVSRYEDQLQELARHRKCTGVICGHIHTAEDKRINGLHYLNSGDWVESLTAIIEWEPGRFQLLHYADFESLLEQEDMRRQLAMEPRAAAPGLAAAS